MVEIHQHHDQGGATVYDLKRPEPQPEEKQLRPAKAKILEIQLNAYWSLGKAIERALDSERKKIESFVDRCVPEDATEFQIVFTRKGKEVRRLRMGVERKLFVIGEVKINGR